MSSTAGEILTDICQTLSSTNAFEAVTVGPDNNAARWPRAEVILASIDESQPDDKVNARWCTLKARVFIYVRCSEPAAAFARVLELADTSQEALFTDRFRGQRCRDLPTGKATELGALKVVADIKEPYLVASFEIRCNFELEEGQ